VKCAGVVWSLVIALAAAGCAGTEAVPAASPQSASAESGAGWRPVTSETYDAASMWVCRPDLPADACRENRDATELRADGRDVVVPFVPGAGPAADCFYVYPTVDLTMTPGNHTDFSDTDRMREWTFGQVARFGETCRLFAPLYRQMTFGTYFGSDEEHAHRFELAYADVLASFRWYLAHADASRPLVLIGHSQGAQMIERLLQSLFDGGSDQATALRARLLVAMPIGGDVQVADGSMTGGTFQRIPLCAAQADLGCVVAFGTFLPKGAKNPWPGAPPKGKREACVNPAAPGDEGPHLLSGAVYPTHSRYRDGMPGSGIASTPFVVVPDFYTARCVDGRDGFRYLAVDEARAVGDARPSPVSFDWYGWKTRLGLHVLDFQLAQDDLIRIVRRRLERFRQAPSQAFAGSPGKAIGAER
jgi:hypothetical protein